MKAKPFVKWVGGKTQEWTNSKHCFQLTLTNGRMSLIVAVRRRRSNALLTKEKKNTDKSHFLAKLFANTE